MYKPYYDTHAEAFDAVLMTHGITLTAGDRRALAPLMKQEGISAPLTFIESYSSFSRGNEKSGRYAYKIDIDKVPAFIIWLRGMLANA